MRDTAVVKCYLVVTGDDYLIAEVKLFKVLKEKVKIQFAAIVCEVARMDENVS